MLVFMLFTSSSFGKEQEAEQRFPNKITCGSETAVSNCIVTVVSSAASGIEIVSFYYINLGNFVFVKNKELFYFSGIFLVKVMLSLIAPNYLFLSFS